MNSGRGHSIIFQPGCPSPCIATCRVDLVHTHHSIDQKVITKPTHFCPRLHAVSEKRVSQENSIPLSVSYLESFEKVLVNRAGEQEREMLKCTHRT